MLEKHTDPLQYGFIKNKGCQKALQSLDCIFNYFTCRGIPVYLAALNASKASDRVNHYCLFVALMKLKIPLPYLYIIVNWHLRLLAMVCWKGYFSNVFHIESGIIIIIIIIINFISRVVLGRVGSALLLTLMHLLMSYL